MTETTTVTTYDFGYGLVPAHRLANGAWVADSARVHRGAIVGEWASVGERAIVGEGASVGEGAIVGEWARVGERAIVGEWASVGERAIVNRHDGSYLCAGPLGSRNAMLHAYVGASNDVVLQTGCFSGSLDELLAACVETHGEDSPYTAEYRRVAPWLAAQVQQCADRRKAEKGGAA